MQIKLTSIVSFLFFVSILTAQVELTTSNLPIIIINTQGINIPGEPKISAQMKIIDNGPGVENNISDEPNDYNGQIGIEIRGQSSRLFPKKAYGLETQKEDGKDDDVSLLGMPKENDWVLHGPYSDKSLIRNALTYSLAGKIMEYAPRIRMVELVINTDYKGVYLLTEKIKRDKKRVNISKLKPDSEDITGGYILKFDKGDSYEIGFSSLYEPISAQPQRTNFLWHYPKFDKITEEQARYIRHFIFEFEAVLKSDNFDDPINGYRKYIDVKTFIDFLFINEISRNVDGYRISTFMYKDQDEVDGRLKMGPVWDFNLAFGNANYCKGSDINGWGYNFNNYCPEDFWVIHFWWKKLLQDKTFLKEMQDRWTLLRGNELSDQSIFGLIDSLSNLVTVASAADRNFQRWNGALGQYVWPNNFIGTTYQEELDYLEDWTKNRLNWLDRQFDNLLTIPTISNSPDAITVFPNPSNQAIKFEYSLNSGANTTIKIYNAMGQFINELVLNETEKSKQYQYTWSQLPSAGIYYYNVVSRDGIAFSGKVVVLDGTR